jgi:hypothetical protein
MTEESFLPDLLKISAECISSDLNDRIHTLTGTALRV